MTAGFSEMENTMESYAPPPCRAGGIAVDDWQQDVLPADRFRAIMMAAETDRRLNNTGLRALLEIMRAIRAGVTPPLKYLAEAARQSTATFKRWVDRLEAYGFLNRTRRWYRAPPPEGWYGSYRRTQATNGYRVQLPGEPDRTGDWAFGEVDPDEVVLAEVSADGTVTACAEALETASEAQSAPPSLTDPEVTGILREVEAVDNAQIGDEALVLHRQTEIDDSTERAAMRRRIEDQHWRRAQVVIAVGADAPALRGLRWHEAVALLRRRASSAVPSCRWWVTIRRDLRDDVLVTAVGPSGPERDRAATTARWLLEVEAVPRWLEARA